MKSFRLDIFTILSSVLALALSSVVAYMQFFYEKSELSAILTKINADANHVDFVFAISNTGTVKQLVLSTPFMIKFQDNSMGVPERGNKEDDLRDAFVIGPNEIKIFVYRVQSSLPKEQEFKVGEKIEFVFLFESIDSKGKRRSPGIRAVTAEIKESEIYYYYYPRGVFDLRSSKDYPQPTIEVKKISNRWTEGEQQASGGPFWRNMRIVRSKND